MLRALVLVVLAACWSGTTPPPAPATPASPPRATPIATLARELAAELRAGEDPLSPASYLDRQLVVLDLDSAAIRVVCDSDAIATAVPYGRVLTDPDARPPTCVPGRSGGVTCRAHSTAMDELLVLYFARREEQWVLTGSIVGTLPTQLAASDEARLHVAHRARMREPGCP